MNKNEIMQKISDIFNTLNLSYYLKNNIYSATLEDAPTSYHDAKNHKIVISYNNIFSVLDNIQQVKVEDIEQVLRALLYHELSHALLTPRDAKALAGSLPYCCEYYNSDIFNIIEDARIEYLNKNLFLNCDFEKNKLLIFGSMQEKEIKDFSSFVFFYLRARRIKDNEEIYKLFLNLIEDTKIFNCSSRKYLINVQFKDFASKLYQIYKKQNAQQNQEEEKQEQEQQQENQQEEKEQNEQNEPAQQQEENQETKEEQEQEENTTQEEQEEQQEEEQEEENATQENAQQRIQKALEQIEEENKKITTNTCDRYAHDQTHNASNFKIDLIQRDEELYQELLKILFACGELGNEIQYQGRSDFGTFSTKFYIKDKINALVNNQDFKRFDNRFKSQEEIKQREEKKRLNLILDNSGSFQFNDKVTNSIIKTLLDIEKVTRFEFDIYILCNTFYKCEKDKRFCISGADQFTRSFKGLNLVNEFNEITKNNTIFLCDGFINYRFNYSKYHYEGASYDTKNLKALDNNKVAIISDYNNESIFKRCKNAQVIYSNDYTQELKENIINVFKAMFK